MSTIHDIPLNTSSTTLPSNFDSKQEEKVDNVSRNALNEFSAVLALRDTTLAYLETPETPLEIMGREKLVEELNGIFLHSVRPMTPQLQSHIIGRLARALEIAYVDKEKGKAMADLLRQNLNKGEYSPLTQPLAFRDRIVQDMHSIYHDDHLGITCYLKPAIEDDLDKLTEIPPEPSAEEIKKELPFLESVNFGIEKAEVDSSTGIGYFKLNLFPDCSIPEAKAKIDEALLKISGAKELIIDLRDNIGGSPKMVARIESHFIAPGTLVNEIYDRPYDRKFQFHTEPIENSFGTAKPIYVLVSGKTFSAAEALAYELQANGRATVIGQRTGGGANPRRSLCIDPHFDLSIPTGKAINPITKTNWEEHAEGKGVHPQIEITNDVDALKIAEQEIMKARPDRDGCCTIQ